MNTCVKYKLSLLAILLFACGRILAFSSDTIQEPDTSNLVNFTLFPKVDPFQSDELFYISLEFDMKSFMKEKYKGKYHTAILKFTRADDSIVEK
ncbi:MAG: hypothetical protein KAT15_01285, partial [Bacteroidales bacterium]|nr:hypothetical protein [Bacteroidales bacterium]